ncbi:DNA-binding transcriptional activator of the SARP family [Glycomyces sambucus]|uniref:DNA-binding transcriptional activator of the SARP family n=1 Tax=Glycomyces sambucus TaxID=380244 RepID=A0A1G9I0B4_9ACTN|nr:BTAD domain-containing putative transcriptional regulator [Glycomyces sambucus]SDL18651.1 DNA-binding transcriptional activator of the SARP family [Glycomyces sambucus]
MRVGFGVLGPVAAWDGEGRALALRGARHRSVLARLIAARGRTVSVERLVEDVWEVPPDGAVGAVRTFVAALRRAVEPERAPRAPARVIVTDGRGYALRAGDGAVDAWRFEAAVAAAAEAGPQSVFTGLDAALGWWRGGAYADLEDRPWVLAERRRLEELRLDAVERRAGALVALGRAGEAVAELDAHVEGHPWREEAWRLLALALHRSGRQAEALEVVRRGGALIRDRLGLDPGPRLRDLEVELLRGGGPAADAHAAVWAQAAASLDGSVGARAVLDSTVGLLRHLAVTGAGGLEAAGARRIEAIEAAERLGDPVLTARVIGAYDVPAVWTRSDDPARAARIVAAAERTLDALGTDASAVTRARLLATVAMESRGTGGPRALAAARSAETIARELGDPPLLAFALNGVFMQSCHRAGLAAVRDAVGAELTALAARHDLASYEVLGRLVRMQARSALRDFAGADAHAGAADALADRHERPLTRVFTAWYAAMRAAATGGPEEAREAYAAAADRLAGAGMPGVERGLEPLARLCTIIHFGLPVEARSGEDWGPYRPWAAPLLALARGDRDGAAAALERVPAPPGDLMLEALWTLTARAAIGLRHRDGIERSLAALGPAAAELAGAGSGMLTAGPVARHLADLRRARAES